jgi:acyl-CoA reductase-like NAD-dependent aldehyde dehydrogenase
VSLQNSNPEASQTILAILCLQEADPDFNSKYIENPSLDAHHTDPSLLPHGAARDRKYITSYDPATGLHLKTFMADSARDIETKIANAAGAQEEWAFSTFADRKRVMKSLKRWLVENQDVCARVASRDSGKTCKLATPVTFSLQMYTC